MVHLLIWRYPRKKTFSCMIQVASPTHGLYRLIDLIKQRAVLFNNWSVKFLACFLLLLSKFGLTKSYFFGCTFWLNSSEMPTKFSRKHGIVLWHHSTYVTSAPQLSFRHLCTHSRVTVCIIAVGAYGSVAASVTGCCSAWIFFQASSLSHRHVIKPSIK